MPGARAVQLAEIADFVDRRMRVTREMQRRISEHRAMPRRQHESVAIRPRRIGGIELQIIRIEQCRDIGHAHRHPGMTAVRSEEHTSELQSLMRISYAVFCLKKKKNTRQKKQISHK